MVIMSPLTWDTLPVDILACIGKRLDCYFDALHFRAVCQSWRSSIPAPRRSPPALPMQLHFTIDHAILPNAAFNVTRRTVFRLEPGENSSAESHPPGTAWIIKVQEESEGDRMQVINPFTRLPIQDLPESFPKELNMLNFRITQISTAYSFDRFDNVYYWQIAGPYSIPDNDDTSEDFEDSDEYEDEDAYGDAVFNRSMHCKVVFSDATSENAYDQAVFSLISGELMAMTVGDSNWNSMDCCDTYRDIINYKGNVYAIIRNGVGSRSTGSSLAMTHLILPPRNFCGERYFVESCGDLFLVSRDLSICINRVSHDQVAKYYVKKEDGDFLPVIFEVFKLKEKNDNTCPTLYDWEPVTDIGDRIFCVSRDCSYSISAKDFAGCKGNCIYFVDELEEGYDAYDDIVDDNEIFVYNLEDGSAESLAFAPEFPNIFWPPPAWLRSNNPSTLPTEAHEDMVPA